MKTILYCLRITALYFILGAAAGALFACESAGEGQPPTEIPKGMVWIGGDGNTQPGFLIDATEVTTAAFGAFVAATNYVTEAEEFGWSGVFSKDSLGWLPIDGATWRYPLGPDSSAAAPDHPVTQISLRDANAYADYMGKRLPTEEEWRWAASQGDEYPNFPWGTEMVPNGKSLRRPGVRRLPRHRTGKVLSSRWQRPLRYKRQRLGMDGYAKTIHKRIRHQGRFLSLQYQLLYWL